MMLGDKIILSRLLPLEAFGAYVFCANLAEAAGRASSAFSSAFYFPILSILSHGNRIGSCRRTTFG